MFSRPRTSSRGSRESSGGSDFRARAGPLASMLRARVFGPLGLRFCRLRGAVCSAVTEPQESPGALVLEKKV